MPLIDESAASGQKLCRRPQELIRTPKLPAALLPVGIPLVHSVADIHRSMVVTVSTLNSLPGGKKGELLEDRLGSLVQEKLEHFLKTLKSQKHKRNPS
jgi:hypothetical protein